MALNSFSISFNIAPIRGVLSDRRRASCAALRAIEALRFAVSISDRAFAITASESVDTEQLSPLVNRASALHPIILKPDCVRLLFARALAFPVRMGLRPTYSDESPVLAPTDSKWVIRDFRGSVRDFRGSVIESSNNNSSLPATPV